MVTGASRGAGRVIAAVLGECGATVYITGRSVHSQPTTDGLPGTIKDTADELNRRGGKGIAETLFQRGRAEQGRLDILVKNAWEGYAGGRPVTAHFWNAPLHVFFPLLPAAHRYPADYRSAGGAHPRDARRC